MRKIIFVLFVFALGLGTGFYLWGFDDLSVTQKMTDLVKRAPSLPALRQDAEKKPLTATEITQRLIGVWQSTDDAKFTRAFAVDSTVVDAYETDPGSTIESRWAIFTAPQGEPPPFPIPSGTIYLKISSVEEVLYFKVVDVTSDTLELMYLDGGGIQKYARKK